MCLKSLIQLSAKVKNCRPQSVRGAVRGNAKCQIAVIFLTHQPTKITSCMATNGHLPMKNVDLWFQHDVIGATFNPTHPLITLILRFSFLKTNFLNKQKILAKQKRVLLHTLQIIDWKFFYAEFELLPFVCHMLARINGSVLRFLVLQISRKERQLAISQGIQH